MIAAALYSLVPAEPTFEIGEPIWLRIRIENHGTDVIRSHIDTGLMERMDKLFVTVTNAKGQPCPDAWRFPRSGWANSKRTEAVVPPGDTGELHIDLAKYAWIDTPGTYNVQLLAPVDLAVNDPKPPTDDPRWVHTQIHLVATHDRAALVASIPLNVDSAMFMEGRRVPWMDINTYDALGHVPFVATLEPIAATSNLTEAQLQERAEHWESNATDERALYGLGACPCTEATAAFVRLYDRLDQRELRRIVERELLLRIPDPDTTASWFVGRAWDARFVAPLLERARAALARPTKSDWMNAYVWGAEVVRRIGDASDNVLLTQALERTLATEPMLHGRRDVVDVLHSALREHR